MDGDDEADTARPERRGHRQDQREPLALDAPGASEGALDLAGLSDAVGYVLRRAQLAVFTDFIQRFAALDLKPAQYSVLLVIGNNPGRNQSEIAAALGIQRTNFVAMLDDLESRGLAARVRSPRDRRSHAVMLTSAGHDLVARARAMQIDQERAIAAILGPGGRETLVDLANRLAGMARGLDEV
jgi:DNA-binding MarR family transcriptional regulator